VGAPRAARRQRLRAARPSRNDAFGPGVNLTLPVGPSTMVIAGHTVMKGSPSLVQVGRRSVALDPFNRNPHNVISPHPRQEGT
jgi:hypothetical protein